MFAKSMINSMLFFTFNFLMFLIFSKKTVFYIKIELINNVVLVSGVQ